MAGSGRGGKGEGRECVEGLARVFSALSHPTRLLILAYCSRRECSLKELREKLGVSKPLLLSHIRVLLRAGLLVYRVDLDEERVVARKLYRASSLELCVGRELYERILRCLEGEA